MKIDYVIISSDENPFYKDFYKPVAKTWKKLGFKTIMIEICEEDSKIENEFGFYIKLKKCQDINSGLQSQIARLYIYKEFRDKNLLISDIDMLPINGNYFRDTAKDVENDKIFVYSGQPYGNVPYHPMCYILSNGDVMTKMLSIDDYTFEDFVNFVTNKYKGVWNTDENYFYDCSLNKNNIVINRDRDFTRRIDRSNWSYDDILLSNGHYIDSHMVRPYSTYKNDIEELINKI